MPNYGVPPVAIAVGRGSRVWDADGKEYLDLIAGIAVSALGHGHPAIVTAVSSQVARFAHTSNLFLHEPEVRLAEKLLSLLGADGRVFLANSGTEANEAAIKLVLRKQESAASGRVVIVAADHSFHGRVARVTRDHRQGVDPRAVRAVRADRPLGALRRRGGAAGGGP